MFAVLITALLCLVSVAHSDDASCENLIKPLDQVDLDKLQGNWSIIAGSLNDTRAEQDLNATESVALYLIGSSYTRVNRKGGKCASFQRDVTIENNGFKVQVGNYNFTGIFYQASCEQCALLENSIKSDNYNAVEFYLLSKNRPVTDAVLEEFRSQAACLKLPAPIVLDPTKELCQEQDDSPPDQGQA